MINYWLTDKLFSVDKSVVSAISLFLISTWIKFFTSTLLDTGLLRYWVCLHTSVLLTPKEEIVSNNNSKSFPTYDKLVTSTQLTKLSISY